MLTSVTSDALLTLPPELSSLRSRKSNSSVDNRSGYASSVNSSAAPSRKGSPLEGSSPSSHFLAGRKSPHSNSDCGSDNASRGDASAYLTPPLSQGDDEKPPYKSRSPTSAGLNMCLGYDAQEDHEHKSKKRHSTESKERPRPENAKEEQIARGKEDDSNEHLQDCNERDHAHDEPKQRGERIGRFIKSMEGLRNTKKNFDDPEGSVSNLLSTTATNITTRRWSSVEIGAGEMPQTGSVKTNDVGHAPANSTAEETQSETNSPENDEILRSVRARLTFREMPANHLPTPATITLRKASWISTELSGGSPLNLDVDIGGSPSRIGKEDQTGPSASTYLITTDDVEFIINLIRSSFDVKRTTISYLEHNSVRPRRPSVTNQGVLPSSVAPVDLAATIEDVHAPNFPHISFKGIGQINSKRTRGGARKLSQAPSLLNMPEVIWEDSRSQEGRGRHFKESSSSAQQNAVKDDSSATLPHGQSSPTSPEKLSLHTVRSSQDNSRKGDDEGDSPTSRVFNWVFKDPAEEITKISGPISKQPTPDEGLAPMAIHSKRIDFNSKPSFGPDVFSFPPLPARKYTSDWISPLPDLSASTSDDSRSLYGIGIDAQVGGGSVGLNASSFGPGNGGISTEVTEHHQNSRKSDSESHRRRSMILHPHVTRLGDSLKAGSALGCSSGARRKSSTSSVRLKFNEATMEHRFHEDNKSWVKPRKDSGWPALNHSPSPEEPTSRKASSTQSTNFVEVHAQTRKDVIKNEDRIELIKSLTPLSPEADHSGIYAALTGAQVGKGSCEPNCESKHMCGNTPFKSSRNPSTDWIG